MCTCNAWTGPCACVASRSGLRNESKPLNQLGRSKRCILTCYYLSMQRGMQQINLQTHVLESYHLEADPKGSKFYHAITSEADCGQYIAAGLKYCIISCRLGKSVTD